MEHLPGNGTYVEKFFIFVQVSQNIKKSISRKFL